MGRASRPRLRAKAAIVLGLCATTFDGEEPGGDDYVICADDKTSISGPLPLPPDLPPRTARLMRVEHKCGRGGALACLGRL